MKAMLKAELLTFAILKGGANWILGHGFSYKLGADFKELGRSGGFLGNCS